MCIRDRLKTLNEDIETIRKIEEQIAELENKNTSSGDNKKDSSKASSVFSDFSGEDFDGNKVCLLYTSQIDISVHS